jgi:hypothetical protein
MSFFVILGFGVLLFYAVLMTWAFKREYTKTTDLMIQVDRLKLEKNKLTGESDSIDFIKTDFNIIATSGLAYVNNGTLTLGVYMPPNFTKIN